MGVDGGAGSTKRPKVGKSAGKRSGRGRGEVRRPRYFRRSGRVTRHGFILD